MAAKYFNIPLGRLPALVELQNLMRRRLPEGTKFNDPDTFHLTLVYVEDDKGVDLNFEEIAAGLPMFGISGDYVTTFSANEDGRAVHLRIEQSPQLIYLQSSIYYRAQAAGAKISEFSYPARWRAHITLASLAADSYGNSDMFLNSGVHMQVDRVAVTESGSFAPVKEWALIKDVPVQEFMEQLQPNVEANNPKIQLQEQADKEGERTHVELTCVSEMKGGMPNLKLPDDIDMAAIQASGMKFVTLPIGQVDARSRNGRNYRRKAYEEMVDQVNTKRPEGGWGHIKDENMGTEYAPPAIRWLRAEMDKNGTIWGKGLPLTQEANQYFELARATNSRVGTSLHAWVTVEGEDDVTGMELIRLDLADPARVGVPMTAAQPHLSTEMQNQEGDPSRTDGSASTGQSAVEQGGENGSETPNPQESSTSQVQEITVPDASAQERVTELERERRTMSEQLAAAEKQTRQLSRELEDAKDVYRVLGLNPTAEMDVVKAARTFKEQYDDMVAENTSLIGDSIASQVKEKVAVESVQPIITKMVIDQKPATRKALTRAIEQVLGDAVVKELIAAKLAHESGPNQPPPAGEQRGKGKNEPAKADKFLDLPEGVKL